jgi:hypothetical protein
MSKPSDRDMPPIDDALLSHLDEIFPVQYPDFEEPDRNIWYRMGQRSVVEILLTHYRKQQEERLG